MTDIDLCIHCGRCCYITDYGKPFPCKYLGWHKDGTSFCRIYKQRLGRVLHKSEPNKDGKCLVTTCGQMKDMPFTFKNCPYNKGKPIKDVGF